MFSLWQVLLGAHDDPCVGTLFVPGLPRAGLCWQAVPELPFALSHRNSNIYWCLFSSEQSSAPARQHGTAQDIEQESPRTLVFNKDPRLLWQKVRDSEGPSGFAEGFPE